MIFPPYLHFSTCFRPEVSVYLPPNSSGVVAIHKDADDGQLWQQLGSGAWPMKGRNALQLAKRKLELAAERDRAEAEMRSREMALAGGVA